MKNTQKTAATKGADNNGNNKDFLETLKKVKEIEAQKEALQKEIEGQRENLIKERENLHERIKAINDALGEIKGNSGKSPGRPKMTEEQKTAKKAEREAKKANGATNTTNSGISQNTTAPANVVTMPTAPTTAINQ